MKKFLLITGTAFVLLFWLIIGPWPVDEVHFKSSVYSAGTESYVNRLKPESNADFLRAGVATINITPATGVPLAGYSAREPKANQGILDPVTAKAITISNGINQVTLLSAEILLPLPELVERVIQIANLKREQLYFTSTHTHSGPGGYAHGLVESFTLGDFDHDYFTDLTEKLAQVVAASKNNLQNVSLDYRRFQFSDTAQQSFIYNQLTDGPNAHDSTHVIQLISNSSQQTIATLVTFSAHPTFLGRINKKVSGDYPGVLMRELEKQIGGTVMFMVGGVGGMLPMGENSKPKSELEPQLRQSHDLGERLSKAIAIALTQPAQVTEFNPDKSRHWQSDKAVIQTEIIPLRLPSANYRITDDLRLSPFLVESIFHGRDTYIQALKIGQLIFFAYPADFSGELALSLEKWSSARKVFPVVHSFNGDYIGYVMPSYRHGVNHYVTRDTNFFGRWSGDYMIDISKKLIDQLYQ